MREAKKQLRSEMRRRRAAVSASTRDALESTLPTALAAHLESAGETERLEAVALYAAKDDEAPADAIISLLPEGGILAYPRVASGSHLVFHHVRDPSELAVGTFDVREPSPRSPIVLPGALALIIIPGLAFDRAGGRLGWGRAYYDRALPEHPDALRVGVAYSIQLIDAVPTDEWDVSVDLIITEEGIIRCNPCI